MSYLVDGLKNYINFSGRATRTQYWIFTFWICLFSTLTLIIDFMNGSLGAFGDYGLVSGIFGLAIFLPSLAITIRRLHDIGKGGVWLLITFIPVVGSIVLLVFLCIGSDPNPNEYGLPVDYKAVE